jgi:hypothetical protein
MSIFSTTQGFNLTTSIITSLAFIHGLNYFPDFRPINNMAFAGLSQGLGWNEGEHRMHQLLNVPENDNPTASFLTPQAAFAVNNFPLTAVGVLDEQGRPWTAIWGGSAGHSRPLGQNLVGTRTAIDAEFDPVVQALVAREFGRDIKGGMMVSGLPHRSGQTQAGQVLWPRSRWCSN